MRIVYAESMQAIARIPLSITGRNWVWRGAQNDAGDDLRCDDLVTQLLLTRGCARDDLERHRSPSIRNFMPDPAIFRDMEAAAQRLANAVIANEKITVFGDYDVDGATSAALLIRIFAALGLKADYYIPDRLMEGYGPSGEALIALSKQGSKLIITVDCGAQAFEALGIARDAGVEVIVVDHHKCATSLPPALALVNPNRLDEATEAAAYAHLAAVGVTFLLGAALVRELRRRGWFAGRAEPNLLSFLDLVALGTVADVAPLYGLNRAFVAQGLKVMAKRGNVGLDALLISSRLNRNPLAHDLGFALGPRINAGGRVGKSDLGVRLLTTDDPAEAAILAEDLSRLNEERRQIEASVQQEAEALALSQDSRSVIMVSGERWHPGVIGIVAGRLKEKFGRPAIVVALDQAGIGKGSGRSITGVDLGAAVLAARDLDYIIGGGGHAMAAGLTVAGNKMDVLHDFLCERLSDDVERSDVAKALFVDVLIAPRGIHIELIEAIEMAGPYGNGWPAPRVATGPLRILRADIVGNSHVRLVVSGDDGRSFKAVAFRQAESILGQSMLSATRERRIWLAGHVKINDWNGRREAELHVDDAAWAD